MIKKIIARLIVFTALAANFCSADFNEYINKLNSLNIETQNLKSQKAVSRYDISKYLNLSDCFDCSMPSKEKMELLNDQWRNEYKVQPWKNFEDILFNTTIYNWKNYYYCVAYAGYKQYFNWYPRWTSPFCPWKFCGTNNTNYAELIQVLVNMLSNYIYTKHSTNREKIKTWTDWLDKNSYEFKYFNLTDLGAINEWYSKCKWDNCVMENVDQFNAYIKYCTYNIYDCKFMQFDNIKQWTWPIAELNILYNYGIIDINTINSMNIEWGVDWESLLNYLYKLSINNSCEFDTDFDKDNITNNNDICPYDYNPSQKDTDKDWIWDVCDDDIDWDWVTNPIWIVDEFWNINAKLLPLNKDNCIFIVNPDQKDWNSNWVWDVCEDNNNKNALYIDWNPIVWKSPLASCFSAHYVWDWAQIYRDFNDWTYWYWEKICHTYQTPWNYTVSAKLLNNNKYPATAKLTLNVFWEDNNYVWFQIKCNAPTGKVPFNLTCKAYYEWSVTNVDWIIENQLKKLNVTDNFNTIITKTGTYDILANWFDSSWKLVWISKAQLIITNDNIYYSNIIADRLKPFILESVNLSTDIKWFSNSNIQNIKRDFWDATTLEKIATKLSKKYDKIWWKIVKQIISLKEWIDLENILTLYIVGKDSSKYWLQLTAQPLIENIGKTINFKTRISDIPIDNMTKLSWTFGDWTKRDFFSEFNKNLSQNYAYAKAGNFTTNVYLYLKNWQILVWEATIYAYGSNSCGTNNSYKCDKNKNGISDMCDDDIDWDWIKNILWLLKYENTDCSINSDNIDSNILKTEYDLASKWVKLDNCPFSPNDTQLDFNANWIWDACESDSNLNWACNYNLKCDASESCSCSDCYYESKCKKSWDSDTDWDWITNDVDACPDIPENINWIQDEDGCPEILSINSNIWSYVQTENCNQCPCQCSDFKSQIWKWDQIRAILLDSQWNLIYNYSQPQEVVTDIKKE